MASTKFSRRSALRTLGLSALALPFFDMLSSRSARGAAGIAKRVIFFYFPDGVPAVSQNGEPSLFHATGSEHSFQLPTVLSPLEPIKNDCVFLNGLSMGPTDAGSHPGGAKKLLTAVDGGEGMSIDQVLAKSVGSDAPWQHLYLGCGANANNASGDKHIVYAAPGQSISPNDDPLDAFNLLFGSSPAPTQNGGGGGAPAVDPVKVSVIDGILDDMNREKARLGDLEKSKLDLHLEALREVEKRIKGGTVPMPSSPSCGMPSLDTSGFGPNDLQVAGKFPAVLRAQMDLMIEAMACGLTRVGTIQASQHTSDLVMSQFPNTAMYDPSFDMRSHQASHYGAAHDYAKKEFSAFVQQCTWWVSQFAYLVNELAARPEGDGTMLDNSLVLLCTEVCDGNTHNHDDMPFILAGGGGGKVSTGRLLDFGGARHGGLFASIGQAMGASFSTFGDAGAGPLPGLVT
jgi:hypothetical protein